MRTHLHIHILTETQRWGTTGVDLIVLFREMGCHSVWDSELEKLLSTQTSELCSVEAWNKSVEKNASSSEGWFVMFQGEVWEASKIVLGNLYAILGYKPGLSVGEESSVINTKSELLKWNLCFERTLNAGQLGLEDKPWWIRYFIYVKSSEMYFLRVNTQKLQTERPIFHLKLLARTWHCVKISHLLQGLITWESTKSWWGLEPCSRVEIPQERPVDAVGKCKIAEEISGC